MDICAPVVDRATINSRRLMMKGDLCNARMNEERACAFPLENSTRVGSRSDLVDQKAATLSPL